MIKIISCEIFKPYIELLNINVDITYLDIEGHNYPNRLAKQIQNEIDQCQDYEQIILLYGLCGNAILHIEARDIPIYVIKVHDCLSVLLGGTKRFYELFQDRLSCGWSCYSLEGKNILFNDFDEEEQIYLQSILVPSKEVYISFSMEKEKHYETKYKEVIKGDISFLKDIILLKSKELLKIDNNYQLKFDDKTILKKEKKNG